MDIIITGVSGGIGSAIAKSFLNDGHTVYGTYLHNKPVINSPNFKKVNCTNAIEVKQWIESISPNLKNLTVINCIGRTYNQFAHKADSEEWNKIIQTNLIGVFNVINATLPLMREQKYGRIINLSSVVGQIGIPGTSAYAASKAALSGLSKSIAVENARLNVTINNLNLGYINAGIIEQVPAKMKEEIIKRIPIGRFGEPADIYKACRFLIDSDYITGTSIDINGGLL